MKFWPQRDDLESDVVPGDYDPLAFSLRQFLYFMGGAAVFFAVIAVVSSW